MTEHYRRKPTVIEVVRWTGDNLDEVREFVGAEGAQLPDSASIRGKQVFGMAFDEFVVRRPDVLWVERSQAWCTVHVGDAIAREPDGSGFYPIAADRLAEDFDPVEAATT